MSASVIRRVEKLLAHAEGATTVEEADAFNTKAAALIAQHGIDRAALRSTDTGPEQIATSSVTIGRGPYVVHFRDLLGVLCRFNGCDYVYVTNAYGSVCTVYGADTDRITVTTLYTGLADQAKQRAATISRGTSSTTTTARKSFIAGFVDGIRDALHTARDDAIAEHPDPDSIHPAVQAHEQRLAAAIRADYPRLSAGYHGTGATDSSARSEGRAAAANADVGRARIRTQPALGRGPGH